MSVLRIQRLWLSPNTKLILAFFLGILVDTILHRSQAPTNHESSASVHGTIKRLEDTPSRPTSHVDQQGKPIMKQQLIEAFLIPKFVGFSVATFATGQTMSPHEHTNLHEFFYVLEGTGIIDIDGTEHTMQPQSIFHLAPHERHALRVPRDASKSMKIAVFGVTI